MTTSPASRLWRSACLGILGTMGFTLAASAATGGTPFRVVIGGQVYRGVVSAPIPCPKPPDVASVATPTTVGSDAPRAPDTGATAPNDEKLRLVASVASDTHRARDTRQELPARSEDAERKGVPTDVPQ